jgi:hypothetical protein
MESKIGIFLYERVHLDAVNALIQTIDGGLEGAVRLFRYVEDEVKNGVAGLQRTCPVPFHCCRGGMWQRFVRSLRLRQGSGKNRETVEKKSTNTDPESKLHAGPPHTSVSMVDVPARKRVGKPCTMDGGACWGKMVRLI